MKTLTPSSLLIAAVLVSLAACGRPTDLEETLEAPAITPAITPTSAPSQPTVVEPANCLPDFLPDQGVCRQAHAVSITAVAAASSGLTIFAGAGLQPEVRVYVDQSLVAYDTTVRVQISVGQSFLDGELSAVQLDALGFFYPVHLPTQVLPDGTYQLQAWARPGPTGGQQDGVPSELLTLVIDRTPPVVTATLSGLPSGPVPRNFMASASLGGTSHTGMAIADLSVRALGPAATPVTDAPNPWASFATVLQSDDDLPPNIATAESFIDGAEIQDDTAGLNSDASHVLLQASATDVLGNVGTFELLIPVQPSGS